MAAKPVDRWVTLKIPGDEHDRLVQIAKEDGRSVATLALQWVRGGIRDWKEGNAT